MKTKVYSNLMKEVKRDEINKTLEHYGSEGYQLVAVVFYGTGYSLFFTKEYIERD